MTMTESQRRRLTEFLGKCWHNFIKRPDRDTYYCSNKGCWIKGNVEPRDRDKHFFTFTTWNETMPLLARVEEIGEWEKFMEYAKDVFVGTGLQKRFSLWIFANFTNPEHTAALVADYLEVRRWTNQFVIFC